MNAFNLFPGVINAAAIVDDVCCHVTFVIKTDLCTDTDECLLLGELVSACQAFDLLILSAETKRNKVL